MQEAKLETKKGLLNQLKTAIIDLKKNPGLNNVDTHRLEQLQAQYDELLIDVTKLEMQAKFGMEHVDKPASPDDKPVDISELFSPLADKIGGQDSSKILKMADNFLSENDSKSTMGAIQDAIEVYKQAELDKADFKKEYADILNEKSEKDKAVRESQRTLYGLLAKYAQTDVSIIELEGDSEGLVDIDIRNADVLPAGTGFSIKYELVANDTELWKWAVMYQPTLLQLDMKKAEAYIKQLRVWSLGKRTSDWYLPLEMPPAEIVPKILPTVGDVFAGEDNVSIDVLNLEILLSNALKRVNIKTIEDVRSKTKGQIMAIRGLGEKSYSQLQSALSEYDREETNDTEK